MGNTSWKHWKWHLQDFRFQNFLGGGAYYFFIIQNIDGTLIQTAEMTKMKWNGKKDQIILNKIALYFGLQYKPSSGAEWKKNTWKENRYK